MQELGVINNRTLIYQKHDLNENWAKTMLIENWLLIVIINDKSQNILDEISRKAIDNNVCYVCCIGKQAELLHDMIDEEVVFREVDIEDHHLPSFDINTTWHQDLSEGLWFAIYAANHLTEKINKILCLDASHASYDSIKHTIYKL